ncbi:hypothetical protein CCY99_02235 [Helicobacter sp. 16-1353]|nr:hypothetical protein CCY99_02235 [Helicobacter sp. 16-1353]
MLFQHYLHLSNFYIKHLFKLLCAIAVVLIAVLISWVYIKINKKCHHNTQSEQIQCDEVKIAEPKYIPIYIAYFIIPLSVSNLLIFIVIFILIAWLVIKGKFSYFNPYLLIFGYHFYKLKINNYNDKYAKYSIFLISKKQIKVIKIIMI